MFRQGMHDLKVWPGVEGDGGETSATPGRTSSTLAEDQMGRLAKVRRGMYINNEGQCKREKKFVCGFFVYKQTKCVCLGGREQ